MSTCTSFRRALGFLALLLVVGSGLVTSGGPARAATVPTTLHNQLADSKEFATVTAMLAPTVPRRDGMHAYVRGARGGNFAWDATSTTADDGGTVLAVSGVTTGRWVRELAADNVYQMAWWGAVFDGSTDDTSAINAGLAALPDNAVVSFPAKKTAKITYPGVQVLHPLRIKGNWANLRYYSSVGVAGQSCLFLGSTTNGSSMESFSLDDLSVEHDTQTSTCWDNDATGIRINNVENFRLGFTDISWFQNGLWLSADGGVANTSTGTNWGEVHPRWYKNNGYQIRISNYRNGFITDVHFLNGQVKYTSGVNVPVGFPSAGYRGVLLLTEEDLGTHRNHPGRINFTFVRWVGADDGVNISQGPQLNSGRSITFTDNRFETILHNPMPFLFGAGTHWCSVIGGHGPDVAFTDYGSGNFVSLDRKDIVSTLAPQTTLISSSARASAGGLAFNGVTPGTVASHVIGSNIGTGDFTLAFRPLVPTAPPSSGNMGLGGFSSSATTNTAARAFTSYWDTAGDFHVRQYGATTSDYIDAVAKPTQAVGESQTIDATIPDSITAYGGKTVDVVISRAGATLTVSVEGIAQTLTTTTGGTSPGWEGSITSTYLNLGISGATELFRGTLYNAGAWNSVLSGTALTAWRTNHVANGVWGTPASTPVISAAVPTNNGGFETLGAGGADVFGTWSESVTGTSTVNAATGAGNVHTGTYALRLDLDGSGSNVAVIKSAVLTAGNTYAYSFWAKSDAAGVRVILGSNDSVTGSQTQFTLTTTWTQYSGSFVAGSTGFLVKRGNLLDAGHSIYFDDLELVPVGMFINSRLGDADPAISSVINDESTNAYHGTITGGVTQVNRVFQSTPAALATNSVTVGGGTAFTKELSSTATLDFPSTLAGASADLTITVTGAAVGDVAWASPSTTLEANVVWSAWVSATNTVTVRILCGQAADPASRAWTVWVRH